MRGSDAGRGFDIGDIEPTCGERTGGGFLDFSFTDEQQALAVLARRIFEDHATPDRLRELETADAPLFDPVLWRALSEAGLLGVAVPETWGGAGLGFLELSLLAEQLGRSAAPVPLVETLVLGALPIARFGSPEQCEALLPAVAEGRLILSAALVEAQAEPLQPMTRAETSGAGWRISGRKLCVPAANLANRVLVPACLDDERIGIFLIDPRRPEVRVETLETTTGQPQASLGLEAVPVGRDGLLGDLDRGAAILQFIVEHATAALCSLALGVSERALELTAEYTTKREQFGQAIATFQAVGQRMADAYVDTEAIRLTSWQAAWRLADGRSAGEEVAIAKYWAAAGGQRVAHTAVHLHGGMGVDRDYPLHRYFLLAKQLELELGGASRQLLAIGSILADEAHTKIV